MGMFDQPKLLSDIPEETPFTLHDVNLGPMIETEYGESRAVHFLIESDKAPGRKALFQGFGMAFVTLAERKDPTEMPARVMIVRGKAKKGRNAPKLVVPANSVKQADGSWETPEPGTGSPPKNEDDDIPF